MVRVSEFMGLETTADSAGGSDDAVRKLLLSDRAGVSSSYAIVALL